MQMIKFDTNYQNKFFFLANAAKTLMQPYFQEIIEQFKGYLAAGDDENLRKLQIQVLGKYSEICLNRTSLGPACVCLE